MNNKSETKAPLLHDGTQVDDLILRMLGKRGLKTNHQISNYLEPQLGNLPKPQQMMDLEKASAITGDAIIENNPILIWGDYDVDGTTATALLLLFFHALGHKKVEYYIPNRLLEGYGLQCEALKRITRTKNTNKKLLITVDNGISAHVAVKTAKNLGYQVVITDHHTPPKVKVEADAILNPRQADCNFPGKNLAGVGVAFYLAVGVRSYLQEQRYFNENRPLPNMKQFLDLVAIGTVADMVDLDNANRILVRAGIETVAKKTNQGIASLCAQNSLDSSMLRSEDISFQIAPKINAAGRLGFAGKAVSLLVSQSKAEADELCLGLIKANEERKHITLRNLSKAIRQIEKGETELENSIVVEGDFHIGVAGIVASNLVEKYHKPAIVLCKQGLDLYKGSARSVTDVNLYDALEQCKEKLAGFGGHAMAAGMSLKVKELGGFRCAFDNAVYELSQNSKPTSIDEVMEEVSVCELFDNKILKQLLLLEPHGTGNPQPVFADTSSGLSDIRRIGSDKSHLRLSVTTGSSVVNGVAFGMGQLYEKCTSRKIEKILYSPSVNFFRGKRSWQVRVVDIQFTNT